MLDNNASSPDTAPYYTRSSSELGGGAVGVVPYSISGTDCDPVDGDTVCTMSTQDWPITGGTQTRETVVLSHYGPVFDSLPSDNYSAVVLQRKSMVCAYPCGTPPDWENVPGGSVVRDGQGTNNRDIWICRTPAYGGGAVAFDSAYYYRIMPRDNGSGVTDLRSDGTLASTAPNVDEYTYTFTLFCDSFASRSESSASPSGTDTYYTIDDLDFLLGIDFNRDGSVDEADTAILFDRLGLSE